MTARSNGAMAKKKHTMHVKNKKDTTVVLQHLYHKDHVLFSFLPVVLIVFSCYFKQTNLRREDGIGENSRKVGCELGRFDPRDRASGHVGQGAEVFQVASVAVHGDDVDRNAVLRRLRARRRRGLTMTCSISDEKVVTPPLSVDGNAVMGRSLFTNRGKRGNG